MTDENEVIYESPSSEPDDEFWLEQGKKMVEDSIGAVRDAAKALITGLGLLKGIYLGILGFARFIPESMSLPLKSFFIVPLLFWLISVYSCLQVMMTKQLEVNLRSPDDIRQTSETVLKEKQKNLQSAFWTLALGLVVAFLLLIFRQVV
jgi:hypothetical protein